MPPPAVGQVIAWLGMIGLTGGAAALAAWGAFRWFGQKWIEGHFAKELEDFRAEKQFELERLKSAYGRETERLKADLGRYADRASKFHTREYEVLPEAWGLMNKAYGAAHDAVAAFQQYADLDSMSGPQLEEWLETSGLSNFQKLELREVRQKNDRYSQMRSRKQIGEAQKAVSDFANYVILQGVFIEEEITSQLLDSAKRMRGALISRSMIEKGLGAGPTDFWQRAMDELQPVEAMVATTKDQVRQRLSNVQLDTPEPGYLEERSGGSTEAVAK